MLTGDHEYESIIFKLLDSNNQNEWIKSRKTGWLDFYKFLEGIYEEALQKKLLLESAQQLDELKGKNMAAHVTEDKCLVCNEECHTFIRKKGSRDTSESQTNELS